MSDSCSPVDCSLPGSSVHGIFQSRILEWVVMSFSRGSSLTSFYWLYFLLDKHPWEGRAPSETSCQLILRDRKVLLKNIVQSILLNVLTLWKDEFGSGSSVAGRQDTAFLVAQTIKHLPAMRETWAQSLGWEGPLEKKMANHSSTLAWKIQWRGAKRRGEGIPKSCICAYSKRIIKQERKESQDWGKSFWEATFKLRESKHVSAGFIPFVKS